METRNTFPMEGEMWNKLLLVLKLNMTMYMNENVFKLWVRFKLTKLTYFAAVNKFVIFLSGFFTLVNEIKMIISLF